MQHKSPDETDVARITILEAIARSLLLTARYNGQLLTLAPHALFARRGDLFVSALNLARNWRSDDERRLGYFKVVGLADVTLSDEAFNALPIKGSLLPRADDELLLAVA